MEVKTSRKRRFNSGIRSMKVSPIKFDIESVNVSLNESISQAHQELTSSLKDEKLKRKASFILKQIDNLPIKQEAGTGRKRIVKLSFLNEPKKKLSKRKIGTPIKNNLSQFYRKQQTTLKSIKSIDHGMTECHSFESSVAENITPKTPTTRPIVTQKFLTLAGYFSLIFSKIVNESMKQLTSLLAEEMSRKYRDYGNQLPKDIVEIRKIRRSLELALEQKQKFSKIRSYEVMEVNGTIPRLFFHIVHLISAKKYKYSNLLKIYHEIQYCARCLQFNKITLRVCFEIGHLLKEEHKQEQAKHYFDKALKLAVYLNDKFSQEKALDCIGLSSYSESKVSLASFYHLNHDKLSQIERVLIKQKYSNSEEIEKLCEVREQERRNLQKKLGSSIKFENYAMLGPEQVEDYEWHNRRKLIENTRQYIQSTEMRDNMKKIKVKLEKISRIGKTKRFEKYSPIKSHLISKISEEVDRSNQILLTHRSLNRVNPDTEYREVERERKLLRELLTYLTSDHLLNFPEFLDYVQALEGTQKSEAYLICEEQESRMG